MKFSVIVPVYNVEKYLHKCVDSILDQNFKDFELILVDDGSTDNSPQICDEYEKKDDRVKVIHKENGGASSARNVGITEAKGDYLLFIDSDDYWHTNLTLDKILKLIDKYQADIVQFGASELFQMDNVLHLGKQRNLDKFNGLNTKEIISDLVSIEQLSISASTMSISRKFVVNNNLFFKEGIKTEDLEWAIRLFSCLPKWCFSNEHLYIYRMQREGSVTATVDYKHLCDYCWILENSISVIDACEDSVKIPLMSYLMYHLLIACALVYRIKLEKIQRKEILSRLKTICKGSITRYTLNKKVKLASIVYCLGGFSIMAMVLGFYLNHRGR